MKNIIHKSFKENFYSYTNFHGLADKEQINLKPTWVINKLVENNKKWDINSLSRFIHSLPHSYGFYDPDFIKLCLIILKETFIKALFLNTQDNASIEFYAARDTANSSSNLCDTLVGLRFEEIFSNMPGIGKITGIERDFFKRWKIDRDFKKWEIIQEKWRAYYFEDINFLMSLIILFSTLDPERDNYYYKIRYLGDEEYNFPDIENGKEILFTKFFDGTEAKYKNKMNSLINKTLKALMMLPNTKLEKIYISDRLDKDLQIASADEYNDIFLSKQYISLQGVKIKECKEMFPLRRGDAVGINNMVGTSKIIAHYKNYFSKKDINFLIYEKAYNGEMSYISCKKSFDLLEMHMKKEYIVEDKNAYIFPK
tara:strand:+ start:132 stop:1238 length:1107 start_codon:yes stop_codon:yes gene_type:complete